MANERIVEIQNTIVAKVIEALDNGHPPWVKPWNDFGEGLPYNAATGRKYNGGNIFWLYICQMAAGYPRAGWMTFNQAKTLGGMVRKGETGSPVVLYKAETKPVLDKDGKPVLDDQGKPKFRFVRQERYFTVFNIAQIDGLPERVTNPKHALASLTIIERHAAADAFFGALPGKVVFGGDRAFYTPAGDSIGMPTPEQFADTGNYYATLAHEYVHWTGHESRQKRFDKDFREATGADNAYAYEELIAEMGAAFLCAELGIAGETQHVTYLAIWVSRLKDQAKMLFQAASAASKAVAYLQDLAAGAMGRDDVAADEAEAEDALVDFAMAA